MALAVSEFQLVLVQLAADLGIKIGRLLTGMDRLDKTEALAFITEAYPQLARAYLAASGELSVQFYNEQPTVSDFIAEPIDLLPEERLAASGRWALLQNNPVQALVGSAERAVMDQHRQTILENLADEYDVPMSELDSPGTRWARQASPNACSFCRLLATRGAVYRSKNDALRVSGRSVDLTVADRRRLRQGQISTTAVDEALERRTRYSSKHAASKQGMSVGDAKGRQLRGSRDLGDKYHDHCKCTAVPVRPGGSYEPPDYVEQWEQDYYDAIDAAKSAGNTKGEYGAIDVKAVLREMDRAARNAPETAGGSGGGGSIPPSRFVPSGMDLPDDYPPMDDGSSVPFTPANRPRPTDEDRERVLSKHRHGAGVPKKTEFPPGWSDDDIMDAIDLTMAAPDVAPQRSGDKITFDRVVDGVPVRAHVRTDGPEPWFWSAYPPDDRMRP